MPEGGRSQSRGKKKLSKQGDLYLLYIYILLSNTIDASCEGGTAGASRHDSCQRSKRLAGSPIAKKTLLQRRLCARRSPSYRNLKDIP